MRKVLIIVIILLCIIPNCFAEIVSVSIENNITGKINKIVIVPYNDKKEREEKQLSKYKELQDLYGVR